MMIDGIKIVINDRACISKEWKQYKFPSTKKKRIRNKWTKRSTNFRMQEVHVSLKIYDTLHVSSRTYDKLSKQWIK